MPSRFATIVGILVLILPIPPAVAGDGGNDPSDGAITIASPRDVDALPATEPVLVSRYGEDDLQYGELRLPAGDGPFPVAIVVHGGCWTVGYATARNTAPLASALAGKGIATWNIEYRQVGDEGAGWPGTFQDWAAAADHLRTLAQAHPLDLDRVSAVGHSAGGHAALWLAARHRLPADSAIRGDNPLPIHAAVNIDGPADIAAFVGPDAEICGKPVIVPLMGGTPGQVPARYAQGNPLALQPVAVPQHLVQVGVLGADDAAAFRARGDSTNAPVTVLVPPDANHFDIIAPGTRAGDAVIALITTRTPTADGTNSQGELRIVDNRSQLPVQSYQLDGRPSELLVDDTAFNALASDMHTRLQALLADYDIRDPATLIDIHSSLQHLALLRGDADTARSIGRTIRELEQNPARKLTSGLIEDAVAAAIMAADAPESRTEAFRTALQARLDTLSWDSARNEILQLKNAADVLTGDLIVGLVQSSMDPVHEQAGAIGAAMAAQLVRMRFLHDWLAPYAGTQSTTLAAYISRHDRRRPSIWADREISLAGREDLTPVVVAVWDSGVDVALYPGQLYVNPTEQFNGRDDDGNGFIDDVHGIAFDIDSRPSTDILRPLSPEVREREEEIRDLFKGAQDLQFQIDSEQAKAARERLTGADAQAAGKLFADSALFHEYAHGTHVAGVAIRDNPAARLLVVRDEFNNTPVPRPISRDDAVAAGVRYQQTIDYLKAHGARVVNMSWILDPAGVERGLDARGGGDTPGQRRSEAMATFRIMADALTAAMASAPEILFVPAAGNSADNVDFIQAIPAGIDLPNVITVGGVDQAGDEVSFTSHGRLVRLHANAHEIESLVPGGKSMHWSGTSLAAPQVVNLAAKLFAIDPSLTVAEVIGLILDGAERSDDGRRNLINPKRSIELLAERGTRAATKNGE